MKLVRNWGRQAARAAGASLIAPLVLLGGAALVAAGGGALGGLGSLGQIASGPSLPSTDLAPAPRSRSLGPAQVVALDLGSGTRASTAPKAAEAGVAPPSGGPAPPQPGNSPGGRGVALAPGGSQGDAPPRRPPTDGGSAPAPPPPRAAPPPPPAAPPPTNVVGNVVDATRDLSESLPAPVGAPVQNTVDPVLGPRQ